MVPSGVASARRTKLPTRSGSAPSLPSASAVMEANSMFSRVCWMMASVARALAAAVAASAWACSKRWAAVKPSPRRAW
jgi:hypothetical protein